MQGVVSIHDKYLNFDFEFIKLNKMVFLIFKMDKLIPWRGRKTVGRFKKSDSLNNKYASSNFFFF